MLIKDIKLVKIKSLSTNAKYAQSDKLKSFVFCDGRNEINNVMNHPGNFDYFFNNSKVCVRIYYNEKLESYLKAKTSKLNWSNNRIFSLITNYCNEVCSFLIANSHTILII